MNEYRSHNIVDDDIVLPPDPAEDFDWSPATPAIAGDATDVPLASWRPVGTSRREFLRGIVCAGAAVSTAGFALRSGGARAQSAARGVERLISLNINGRKRRVDVAPNETLAHTIRYKLGMTGTKIGCNRAECGACTVISSGQTIYSCSTLTHRVRDQEITTIEGIAGSDGSLHPVQQAFIDELGPQCGFCTPGQVMSAVALLASKPNPSVDEARRAMSGNLCRCGAYDHYLKGVMRAAKGA